MYLFKNNFAYIGNLVKTISRSSVFKAMFSHEGFKEEKEARIVVENLQPENLEKILQYIYTDQVLALTLSRVSGYGKLKLNTERGER